MNREQQARTEYFHRLHDGPAPLMLPNAWDVASARVIENAGAKAIATTSAGMAWSLGYRDGEQMPVQELLAGCKRICRAVKAPVTVDIERGYGRDAQDTGDLVAALIDLGVAGINIEDGTLPGTQTLAHPAVLCARIACARTIARDHGLRLFINARIDTYFSQDLAATAKLEETRTRALAYIDAGADGIFVPGLANLQDIATLARALPVPLNIYAGYPGAPPSKTLGEHGVRRISLGCGPIQAALAHLARMASEAIGEGRYDTMSERMFTVAQANGLFAVADTNDHDDATHAIAAMT
ncbi:isocitrate lyase/phosphoenolpyruvate mutase family protein [Dyella sp.]|uniref:isocitrate lyase/PEP mutase family protein n=1 Tax=Dyella sp. TaxID=1869338 RepID=UPI002B47ECEE|nr:isocitrate lyase/phosphoenolpyruvate mutase family protein [Dyella sp.]HKT30291.1 isocitrate lyase/phosphoenolpyruvate mutase family protein [Dyella sp.]